MDKFTDRVDAGRRMAAKLALLRDIEEPIVLGLPRGGVPVAYEVALALNAPLDILVVRKIGAPRQSELAMGAVGEEGVIVVDDEVMAATHVSAKKFAKMVKSERVELVYRVKLFRGERSPTPLVGRTVVIVDDGVATGSTARAACRVARARGATSVVLAVPVIAHSTVQMLRSEVDRLVSILVVDGPFAVGQWYKNFDSTLDGEVVATLRRASLRGPTRWGPADDASS